GSRTAGARPSRCRGGRGPWRKPEPTSLLKKCSGTSTPGFSLRCPLSGSGGSLSRREGVSWGGENARGWRAWPRIRIAPGWGLSRSSGGREGGWRRGD
ncbi:unnamed protein product, partial [Ectocarpus fasciculatus]